MAESRFNFITQLAGGFLGAVQRNAVCDAYTVVILRLLAFDAQLFIHLRAKAVYQDDLDTHGLD
ncbi:hypothetical protein D3C72_1891700 [compost metagenome]